GLSRLLHFKSHPLSCLAEKLSGSIQKASAIPPGWQLLQTTDVDDSQLVEARHPARYELDAITTEIPLMIMHQSGHLGVYNSRALLFRMKSA
ncbi:MAG: putative amidohydrolase YtcJ, partial [Pseudohongiellaceae bacterium]